MENFLYVHGGFDTEQPNVPTDSILRMDMLKLLNSNQVLVKQLMKQTEKQVGVPDIIRNNPRRMEIEEARQP